MLATASDDKTIKLFEYSSEKIIYTAMTTDAGNFKIILLFLNHKFF